MIKVRTANNLRQNILFRVLYINIWVILPIFTYLGLAEKVFPLGLEVRSQESGVRRKN
ncbi:hypothetical protein H6G54_14115 [Anabaena cylindrica FACHB-243]|uniref:hypothetical protein n=1 Tax=Anabaena TaxID=1163 RepID=UPI0002FA3DC0|nr:MULTISPECIES: hypothetical protein [Anabaena]MBD2418811.1 hypothetical protein [Anabaena cylindrica FACHB-243]MCM2406376.1 hypothetical protein [Anabaena sp. CCAP 1446/1C]